MPWWADNAFQIRDSQGLLLSVNNAGTVIADREMQSSSNPATWFTFDRLTN